MSDALIILRKEATEMAGDPASFRGTLVQALVVVLVCGVIVPLSSPDILEKIESSVMSFTVFPMIVSATIAADVFAGERERGTLETLLATPLSEADIFLGKAGFAAAVSFAASAVALASALLISFGEGGLASVHIGTVVCALLLGSLAGGSLIAALVALISLKVTVARSAQQIGSMLSLGLAFAASFGIHRFWATLSWKMVQFGNAATAGVALLAMAAGMLVFKHSRLLGER